MFVFARFGGSRRGARPGATLIEDAMIMPTLPTDRLVLRPLEDKDSSACLRILYGDQPDARETCAAWLAWQIAAYREQARMHQPPYGDRAVILRSTGEMIGAAGLVPSLVPVARTGDWYGFSAHAQPEVGLYYELTPDARGQGYATEIARALCAWTFDALNLSRIVATTTHDNRASRAVMERLGMEILVYEDPEPAWLQVVGVLPRPAPAP